MKRIWLFTLFIIMTSCSKEEVIRSGNFDTADGVIEAVEKISTENCSNLNIVLEYVGGCCDGVSIVVYSVLSQEILHQEQVEGTSSFIGDNIVFDEVLIVPKNVEIEISFEVVTGICAGCIMPTEYKYDMRLE